MFTIYVYLYTEYIYKDIQCVFLSLSLSQPLTDKGAALLYGMKHSNTNSISLRDKQRPQ